MKFSGWMENYLNNAIGLGERVMAVKLQKMNLILYALQGTYTGYANPDFYFRGYAAHFEFEVSVAFMNAFKQREANRNYEVLFFYDPESDCFVYQDIENFDDRCFWYGQDLMTEDGLKHLYPVGEGWWWEATD